MANIIDLVINGDAKNAVNSLKSLNGQISATKTAAVLMISTLEKLWKKLYKFTDYSDNYTTSLRLLKTTLGETSKEASTFINRLSNMSGLDENRLMKSVAKFSQLGESLNLSNEYAEQLAEGMSVLSTKLAILYNTDYDAMANKVQRAIQGTQTSLKAATGIYANEVSEQALLMQNGINREVSSLNDAEKAIVRYATILNQVSKDNNVYQQSVNSLAWQKQILTAQTHRLATAVGQILTPVFTNLLIILNAVLMVIIELISAFASLFGFNLDLSASADEAAGAYDNLGSSIGGASKAANKALRGFDKLNNITTPSSGGGGGGSNPLGIDNSLLSLLKKVDDNFLNIRNKAEEIKDNCMEWLGIVKVIDPITGSISHYLKTSSKATEFWDRFVSAMNLLAGLPIISTISTPLALVIDTLDFGVNVVKNFRKQTDKLAETSTETIQRLKPVRDAFENLIKTVNSVSYDHLALTEEGKTKILNSIDTLTQELKAALQSYTDEQIKELNYLYYEVGLIDEQTYKNRLKDLQQYNKDRNKEIDENGNLLKEKTQQIYDENGNLIISAYADWLKELQNYENDSLIHLTTSEQDKQEIMSRMQSADLADRKKYYSELLKGYIEDRENAKQTAKEKYEKTLEYAKNTFGEGSLEYEKIRIMAKKTYDQEVTDAETAYDNMYRAFEQNNQDIARYIDRDDGHVRLSWSEMWEIMVSSMRDTLSKIKRLWDGFSLTSKIVNLGVKTSEAATGRYATGGFPEEGQLFFARENGPELVGSMNGHTAVANNEQIVAGIQSGVFSAMMSALSHADFGGTTVIEASGDMEGLMNFITFKQRQKERQFN